MGVLVDQVVRQRPASVDRLCVIPSRCKYKHLHWGFLPSARENPVRYDQGKLTFVHNPQPLLPTSTLENKRPVDMRISEIRP